MISILALISRSEVISYGVLPWVIWLYLLDTIFDGCNICWGQYLFVAIFVILKDFPSIRADLNSYIVWVILILSLISRCSVTFPGFREAL